MKLSKTQYRKLRHIVKLCRKEASINTNEYFAKMYLRMADVFENEADAILENKKHKFR